MSTMEFWAFVKKCGIDMHSMSTDLCVERNRDKLVALKVAIEKGDIQAPAWYARNLENVLRRTVANRVNNETAKVASSAEDSFDKSDLAEFLKL